MEKAEYDLVIIGGGPAGLTAGLYAARSRLNVLLLEQVVPGGQVIITDWIENYPGFPEGISGPDLVQKMTEQVKQFDLKIQTAMVTAMDVSGDIKKVFVGDKQTTAYAVIIATGASPRKLGIPGEDTFFGRGVSACGTCDAPFFKERDVAAVGGGDTAVQESIYLTKFAKKVYLIHRRDELRAQTILRERALSNPKIEMVWDSVPTSINGDTGVESVTVKNVKTEESRQLAVDGCFIWIGITPNTQFVNGSVELDEGGFVKVDAGMQTSVPGVYAAGDVRNTNLRQIVTAVGDAANAAFSAEQHIENLKA
jgi:thioredoxin reductase (NADPH)